MYGFASRATPCEIEFQSLAPERRLLLSTAGEGGVGGGKGGERGLARWRRRGDAGDGGGRVHSACHLIVRNGIRRNAREKTLAAVAHINGECISPVILRSLNLHTTGHSTNRISSPALPLGRVSFNGFGVGIFFPTEGPTAPL